MTMNPMQKKARTSFLLGVLITLIIAAIVIAFLILQISKMKKEQEAIVYKTVYVLSQDVTSGDNLNGKAKLLKVESTYAPNNAITTENQGSYIKEGSTAKISLRAGTVLTTDMVNAEGKENTADVRTQEYNMVILPSQLVEGETVDIRLRLPSGEDYIVLSKKYIKQTDSETIWIDVSEEEILTMSNAVVEAYRMEGALLYATTYLDAGMQNAATPTYIASQDVISLMNSDPNITVTAMNALSQRYTEAARNQRNVINQALNGYADEGLQNIETKIEEEIEKQKTARRQYVDGLSEY